MKREAQSIGNTPKPSSSSVAASSRTDSPSTRSPTDPLPLAPAHTAEILSQPSIPSPTPATVSPQPPPSIPDHELLRRIGAGSYGQVWLARRATRSPRAVKMVFFKNFDHVTPY